MSDTENPFSISIAENEAMGCHALILQVGGLTKEEAEKLSLVLSDWLIKEGGWKEWIQ